MENNTTKSFYNTVIPSDWTVKKLSQIANVKTGPFGAQLHESDYVRVGTPIITVEHLSENGIVHYNLPLVSSEDKERLSQYILLENDIVFSRVGSVDRNSLITDLENGWLFSGRLLRVRINYGNNSLFVSQYFNSDSFKQLIRSIAVGQTMPSLNTEILSGVQIPLPPLSEQRAIAHVLSLMDSAINKNNQLIAQKELRKKWLMQNLLTSKKRLNQNFQDERINRIEMENNSENHENSINSDSDNEKRLKGFYGEWKEVHIKDIAREVSIRNKSNKQLTVLSCTKYDGLVPSLEYFGRKIFSDDVSTYKIVPKNHFAYATNHIEEGSLGYQEVLDEALISPMYTVFKTNETVNDTFFYRLLKSHPLVYQYQNRMEGSIDRRGGLRWDAFSIIKIKLPSLEEQTAIAHVLQAADKEIQLLKIKTEKLREQKKGMMQVLLTGKVRIKNLNL